MASTPKYNTDAERAAGKSRACSIAGKRGGTKPGDKKRRGEVNQLRFVEGVTRGLAPRDAAVAAGYSPESSGSLLKNEHVRHALDAVRKRLIETGIFNIEVALTEANVLIDEARDAGQYSAAAKLLEVKAKIMGLVADRIEIDIEPGPNLLRALAAAEGRLERAGLRPPIDVTDVLEERPAIPAPSVLD